MSNTHSSNSTEVGRWLTRLRRAGLLALLPADVWHTLCAVLSFASHDNACRFSLDQIAGTLGASRDEARRRLTTLAQTPFRGQPVAHLDLDADGACQGARVIALAELMFPVAVPAASPPAPMAPALSSELMGELAAVGLNPAQIDALARRFSEAAIQRQMRWLPARGARNPAALLIRAIEQDWSEPKEPA